MADPLMPGDDVSSDVQLDGIVQSLSDWVELDAPPDLRTNRSLQPGSPYNIRLLNLDAARRRLLGRIENQRRTGMPTTELERDLEAIRLETRSFLAYLESHARVRL